MLTTGFSVRVATSILCAMALLMGVVSGCATPQASEPGADAGGETSLVLMSITAGGGQQMKMDAVAEAVRLTHPEWNIASMAAGGESRLIEKRISGEADFYFSSTFRQLELEVFSPLHPDIDFEKLTAYSPVLPSSIVYVQLFALGRTGLETPADIVAQRYPFTIGCGAGIMRALFSRILQHYGSSIEESEAWGARYETMIATSSASVESLQAGRTDMGFSFGSLPAPALLGATFDLRYLPLSEPGLVQMLAQYGCAPAVIPAGTHPFVTSDVQTVATYEALVTRTDTPEDIVYGVCEAMLANRELLIAVQPATAQLLTPEAIAEAVQRAEQGGQPYHPGALSYFRDCGWID